MAAKIVALLLAVVAVCSVISFFALPSESALVFETRVNGKIYSDPIKLHDSLAFVAGDKVANKFNLYRLNLNGLISAKSVSLPSLPHQPFALGSMIAAGDHSCMIRGFKNTDLRLSWESGAQRPFLIAPIAASNNSLIVLSNKNVLHCLNCETGEPIWDYTFQSTVMSYGVDKGVIVCLYGYDDTKIITCKATALSAEDGSVIWHSDGPFEPEMPMFADESCFLSALGGGASCLNTFSGETEAIELPKAKPAASFDGLVLFVNNNETQLIGLLSSTGESWKLPIQGGLVGASRVGGLVLAADKHNLTCLKLNNGEVVWHKNLKDIYNAFQFRQGIFVTYKDSFFARDTYGAYFSAASPEHRWLVKGKSIFMKPVSFKEGDLILSREGQIKMLLNVADPKADDVSTFVMPIEKTNFMHTKNKASAENEKNVPAPAVSKQKAPRQQNNQGLKAKDSKQTQQKPALLSSQSLDLPADVGW